MSKTALVILAPGAENLEFAIVTDILRRAEVKVTVAGLNGIEPVKCSTDIVVVPDVSLESQKSIQFDAVVLPGGIESSKALSQSALTGEVLKAHEVAGRLIAAICAAPTALQSHGIGYGKNITSYPWFKTKFESSHNYVEDKDVVHDGNMVTSRGPGTSFAFALKVAELLVGEDKVNELAQSFLIKRD